MGVTSSKQDAFVGDDNQSKEQQQPCISCFQTFFCPPNQDSSSSTPKRRHNKTKSFGTPLPDTPENVRRIRENDNTTATTDEFYYNEEDNDTEEKKIGGSLGRNNELRSSRYGGLEKEISGMFSYENNNAATSGGIGGGGGVIVEEKSADIHDGKVSWNCNYCYLLNSCTTFTVHSVVRVCAGITQRKMSSRFIP